MLIDCKSGEKWIILDAPDIDAPVFRWLGVDQHPTRQSLLAVEGRYDGSPCRVKLVDFSNVDRPKCLNYFDQWYSEFTGWVSDRAIRFIRSIQVRSRDNRQLDAMTQEEMVSHIRSKEATHDRDEILDVDVAKFLDTSWHSDHYDPLMLKLDSPAS
jgi:hypothetical protein